MQPDYFLPMATKLFDMRIKGQYSCEWQEEFNERGFVHLCSILPRSVLDPVQRELERCA